VGRAVGATGARAFMKFARACNSDTGENGDA